MGLLNLLSSGYDFKTIVTLVLFTGFIVVFSLTIHEVSHGLCALALGDPTAKNRGRLTLNPLKHMNPVGAMMMLLIGFGYAEPVPINPNNFKNRKVGMAITAFAGPFSNFILAVISTFVFGFTLKSASSSLEKLEAFYNGNSVLFFVAQFFYYMAVMNLALMVFNLIPIPPLDGSRILNIFLPEKYYFRLMRYEQYIALIFFLVIFVSSRVFHINILFGIPEWIFERIYDLVAKIIW